MGLFTLIRYALTLYEIIILGRALISWFPGIDPYNPIVRFLYNATEPVLKPIRDLMPPGMMIDFSPLIVLVIIQVLLAVIR